ncbi:MAG: nuclear pore protein 84/107 [Benjaminiella poitrasii]|nr:MAG: nuclear pore protein 84/107 [Benjaminiella poitrasii]
MHLCYFFFFFFTDGLTLENKITTIEKVERSSWREIINDELKEKEIGDCKRVLFEAIGGRTEYLYEYKCDTWEDVIWTHLNSRTEDLIDIPEGLAKDNSGIILTEQVRKLATSKDLIMDKDDPRILFHHFQAAILSNSAQDIIKHVCQALVHQESDNTLNPHIHISHDTNYRELILRFVSTLILYGCRFLGWQENVYTAAILSAYGELNADPTVIRPLVIATIASERTPEYHIPFYSHFLQNFDGDDDECAILIQLGKEHNLQMPDILQYTHAQLFKKAVAKANIKMVDVIKTGRPVLELSGEYDRNEHGLFFRALDWLMLDEGQCVHAFQAANMTIRYFLGACKVYLAKRVLDSFSKPLFQRIHSETTRNKSVVKIVQEYKANVKLVDAFLDFERWEKWKQNKPEEGNTPRELVKFFEWRNEAEKLAIKISNDMTVVLEGHWPGEDVNETALITKAALRRTYIPEAIIRYHRLLSETKETMPRYEEKCKKLNFYITNKYQGLLEDIKGAKRTAEVIQELSKSLTCV